MGLRGGTELEAKVVLGPLIHGPHRVILWEPQNSANRDTSPRPTLLLPWDSEEERCAFVGPLLSPAHRWVPGTGLGTTCLEWGPGVPP